MKLIVLCLLATLVANAQTAKPTYPVQDEIRAVFVRFVAAQNAHDADTVGSMIWDSPDFLWVSRGNPVRGSQQAIAIFRSYYKGTWHLEPDMTRFSVTPIADEVVQLLVGQLDQQTGEKLSAGFAGGRRRLAAKCRVPR